MSRTKNILAGIAKSDRVAGAYLFVGPPGVGKRAEAEAFADQLQCKKQDKLLLVPDGASFKIDQVRELQTWVRYGPSASRYLLVIIDQADTITGPAAAAFLKTLEEPAPGVVFILLAEREDKIPKTVISRCQKIIYSEKAEEWQLEPGFASFYEELKKVNKKNCLELFEFSGVLEKEKEGIEALLYSLSHFARHRLSNVHYARVILDTLRHIKRKANLRLALNIMCLKLGAAHVR